MFAGNEFEEAFKSFFEKRLIHVLIATREEEVDFDTVPFLEPLGGALRFYCEIAVTGSYLDLYSLRFRGV